MNKQIYNKKETKKLSSLESIKKWIHQNKFHNIDIVEDKTYGYTLNSTQKVKIINYNESTIT